MEYGTVLLMDGPDYQPCMPFYCQCILVTPCLGASKRITGGGNR